MKKAASFLFIFLTFLTACTDDLSQQHKIEDFSFINQREEAFGTQDLTGQVWVANFIFSNCSTVCPPMMKTMANLQETLKSENLPVELVSFTVDPDHDRPEVLKSYIGQFTKEDQNWNILSGYSQEQIEEFAFHQFDTIVQKPKHSSQVIHGINFYLIDQEGYLIKEYNLMDQLEWSQIITDIKKLLEK